jgi:hypothetical protein
MCTQTYETRYLFSINTNKGKYLIAFGNPVRTKSMPIEFNNLERLLIIEEIRKLLKKSNTKWYRLFRNKKIGTISTVT